MEIIPIVVTCILSGGMGALLGYGSLLWYKSEDVLNIELRISEHMRFTELPMIQYSFGRF